ncbi:hypothetical protein AB0K43_29520 [Kitasatospora sp. NPDC049258]|uniref:hypothetical protein n=1 Tax=Kitasatospora sp. NPDC049258 TaxID=3155394 RepID=UPI0034196B78
MPKIDSSTDRARPGRRPVRCAVAAATAVGALLCGLTACGSSSDAGSPATVAGGGQGVASLPQPSGAVPTAGAGSPAASAGADAGRPQLRLDSTPEESQQLYQAFYSCLAQHGFPTYNNKPIDPLTKHPEAYDACRSKEPLEPPETDPAKNPHYQDNLRTEIACENAKGLRTSVSPDGLFPSFDEPMPGNWGDVAATCHKEAFGAHH